MKPDHKNAKNAKNANIDQQCSDWLDHDNETPCPPAEPPEDAQGRIADLQMVDALLANLSANEIDDRESRIQRVMDSIESAELPKKRYVGLSSTIAIAASLLVLLGVAWSQFSRETRASIVLREISEAAFENVDRIYTVRRHHTVQRHSSGPSAEQKADAKLYLRGRDGFVLSCGTTVLGRSDDEYWLVPEKGDVLIADSFRWIIGKSDRPTEELELLILLSSNSRRVPIMQLSSVVELMRHDYRVTLQPGTTQDLAEHAIVGTLKKGRVHLPRTISLWADAKSSIIRRVEFSWAPDNSLSLELGPTEEVPWNWYTRASHCDEGRKTRRVFAESL